MRLLLLAALLLLSACSSSDLCAEAPSCDEEGLAINCEPGCTVGPCSNGPQFQQCAEAEACSIVTGDINSPRFFRSRALCTQSADACDPATAAAPVCDGAGAVTGCSAYKRVIRISCSQAGLYFENAACCRGGTNPGPPDAGSGTDGGVPNGADGGR